MKFIVEDQYPQKWISGNEAVPPVPGCERAPWKHDYPDGTSMEGADYTLDINSLEELLELGKQKECNLFINISDMRIVFTANDEPD